ncbi:putative fatty acyl-AMP ligase and polyketide synthase [Mycobacterium ulcerans str. Harvey]|uniref:Fatty acyl-AMP ligase and polyketide synthase n=1 Tax=Mycobacterium ulcerans str. Harvey TaxID=1299332 RepID=A0ABN0RA90_MYCUL|nr:putative fatty acyl-AMP ligase and polyketide synthase [Mycobacterium ulcerans str. Harvey]
MWIYDREADMDGLRRSNENLGYGLLGAPDRALSVAFRSSSMGRLPRSA